MYKLMCCQADCSRKQNCKRMVGIFLRPIRFRPSEDRVDYLLTVDGKEIARIRDDGLIEICNLNENIEKVDYELNRMTLRYDK